jgi:hypothetical protein
MKMNEFLLFVVPCLTLLYSGLTKLILAEWGVRRDVKRISEMGFRNYLIISSWRAVLTSVCFFLARGFVDLKVLWISVGVILLIAPIFFTVRGSGGEYVESMFNPINEEQLERLIRKKRKQGLVSIALLLLWIYSWRNLLT